jgi:hypothetical protein
MRKLTVTFVALASMAALTILAPAGVAQASTSTDTAGPAKFCASLVGVDESHEMTTIKRSCSNESAAAARAGLGSAGAESTLLMTWYADAQFQGSYENQYGNYGICDSAGYGFTPSNWWAHNLSSISGNGACNRVRLTDRAGQHSANYVLNASFGKDLYNDNVGHVAVFNG